MSPEVRETLETESVNGMKAANRSRYLIALLLGVYALSVPSPVVHLSFSAIGIFLIITLIHTLLINKKPELAIKSSYGILFFDYFLLFILLLIYTVSDGRGNFVWTIKNPTFWLLLIPVVLQILQFRIKLMILAIGLMLAFHYALLVLLLADSPQWTDSWYEYLMGDKVVLVDVLISRAIVVLGIGAVMVYNIYRSIRMVRQLGEIKLQKSFLSRYFSPKVVEDITANAGNLPRGKEQKAAILFADIRGFTRYSETVSPDELVQFLTAYRERMTKAIFEYEGTIDKFIGDAVMATFGTPAPSPEPGRDSRNAVQAGLVMLDALAALNRERAAESREPIRMGIGIHTGNVIAGNIGRDELLEYTVIGDTVNTASRIEGLCKTYKADFLISKAVHNEVLGRVQVKELPPAKVKGKEHPLQVYEVLKTSPGAGFPRGKG